MRIHYQSDINFLLNLKDAGGNHIGFPSFDFEAHFYTTTHSRCFVASCRDGVAIGCYNDDGQLHIAIDNHHLPPGKLRCDFVSYIPDDKHRDGSRRVVKSIPIDIELVMRGEDTPTTAQIEASVPFVVKGYDRMMHELEAFIGASIDVINDHLETILGDCAPAN